MEFELKDEYIQKGKIGKPSLVILPSGTYKIIMNPMGNPVKENNKCDFLKEKMRCLLIQVGFMGIRVCGDILITMVKMGYDLASKDDWKKSKKDKNKIVLKYNELIVEKPELFDEKRIKDTQLNSKKTVTKTKPSKKVNKQKTKRKSPSIRRSTKKLDEKLKADESTESVEETSSDELKKLGQQKKDGKLTEKEFQKKKEEILAQSSNTKGNKTDSPDKKKKGFFESALERELGNRLEKVTKLFSTDQEALKEWKKYKRQYKNKKITLTALRKKAKEIQEMGFRLAEASIKADLTKIALDRELKKQGISRKIPVGHPADHPFLDDAEKEKKENERLEKEHNKIMKKQKTKQKKLYSSLQLSIPKLLTELGTKIPASDIDAHLKHKNVNQIKWACEKMYHDGEISRTSNYRYFVLTKKESKPTKSKQVDIGKELKKFKDLLDQELITQDDYDAKKKELLGL